MTPLTVNTTVHIEAGEGGAGKTAPDRVTVLPAAPTVPDGQLVVGLPTIDKPDGTTSTKFTPVSVTGGTSLGLDKVIVTTDVSSTKILDLSNTFVESGGATTNRSAAATTESGASADFTTPVTLCQRPFLVPVTGTVIVQKPPAERVPPVSVMV